MLAVTGGLLVLFLLAELLLRKSRDFQPDFLASALLYGLTVLNLSLLLVLLFVLGPQPRARCSWSGGAASSGARFRLQLLLVFLLMAIAPSLLILLVGSDLIRQTVDRWFNVDVERMLVLLAGARAPPSTRRRSRRAASTRGRSPREIEARGGSWRRRSRGGCGARSRRGRASASSTS